ncbi:MAG: adenylate/guanylate cyclase domain-containing protein [Bacteroidota bacterium]
MKIIKISRLSSNLFYRCFSVFLLFATPCLLLGQDAFLDSLINVSATAQNDTNQVIRLTDIAWELKFSDYERAKSYIDQGLTLAAQLDFKRGEGLAHNFRGVIEDIHGNSDTALVYFQKALDIRQSMGDRKGVASLYNNMGNVHENLGEYIPALNNYLQSLQIREEIGDTARAIRAYYNIAILYESMGNYPEALDYAYLYLEGTETTGDKESIANGWNVVGNVKLELGRFDEAFEAYEKALQLHQELGNDWEVSSALNNLGNVKDAVAEYLMDDEKLGDSTRVLFDEAVDLLEQALNIREELKDTTGVAEIYNNMGYVLKNVGSYYKELDDDKKAKTTWLEAEKYLRKSLTIVEPQEDKASIMRIYNGLSDVRRREERFKEALSYAETYYDLAKELDDAKFQQNGLKDLARIHNKLGNYKKAYKFRKKYDELRYERFNEKSILDNERRIALNVDRKTQLENQQQQQALRLQEAALEREKIVRNSLIGIGFLLLLLAVLIFNRNKIIAREKQRSDSLLLNILPEKTAEELKKEGKAKAHYHEQVTVLFTDFKSFTSIAEQTSPEDLVAELDTCFKGFDDIISKYKIEKIKTIGDAYLCAAGLPSPSPSHAIDMVNAAIDIQRFMEKFRKAQQAKNKNEYYCRIGIHSGPVVSGVVGKKKFAYDIWGDTVNVAARMEQTGEVNEINISQKTYELVKDQINCLPRGKVAAKNKGDLDMYFVDFHPDEKKIPVTGSV